MLTLIRLLQLRGVPVEHLAAEKKFINLTPIQKRPHGNSLQTL